ncbi:MAG TPA: hypothetical protein VN282_23210 [Pyrinomonadaceae bacterium]|nr:hypothetical protein [Pyrinomonadaceae bacterium]
MLCYKLEAFLLNHRAAEMLPDDLRHLHRFRLNDRVTLVPITEQLCEEVVATFGKYRAEDDPYEDTLFMRLHPALIRMAVKLSFVSAVFYIEVDAAGGFGDRTVIVWHQGEAVYGPCEGGNRSTEALDLFARLEGMSLDQLTALNIFRHRFTEDWVRDVEGESD